jgi:hypothetical protein
MHRDHRTLKWLVLFGYTVVAAGMPLPVGSMLPGSLGYGNAARRLEGKDRSTPFPCMNSPCGCVTAAQCFESCCCHTPAELLAWASARNVSGEVLVSLSQRVAAEGRQASAGACCGDSEPAVPSCCDSNVAACCEAEQSPVAAINAPLSESVVVLQAVLACGGLVSEWLACAAAPLPPVVAVSPLLRRLETRVAADETERCVARAVDLPPPRVG